jgi:hypothetical protein
MAASRWLKEPVVIITLAGICAAGAGWVIIPTNKTSGMKKPKGLILIDSSDNMNDGNGFDGIEIV